jgi:hypothetical protein
MIAVVGINYLIFKGIDLIAQIFGLLLKDYVLGGKRVALGLDEVQLGTERIGLGLESIKFCLQSGGVTFDDYGGGLGKKLGGRQTYSLSKLQNGINAGCFGFTRQNSRDSIGRNVGYGLIGHRLCGHPFSLLCFNEFIKPHICSSFLKSINKNVDIAAANLEAASINLHIEICPISAYNIGVRDRSEI